MLVSLADVKTFMGITGTDSDDVLNLIISQVDQYVKTYTKRDLESAVIADEEHTTDGQTNLYLVDEAPITVAPVITFDGDAVDSDEYDVFNDEGLIVFKSVPSYATKKLLISYTGGFVTIPLDLQMAVTKIVAGVFNNRKATSGVKSEKLGDYAIAYGDSGASDIDAVIDANRSILDAYSKNEL